MCLDMGKLPLTLQSVPANVNRGDVIVPPPSRGTQNKKPRAAAWHKALLKETHQRSVLNETFGTPSRRYLFVHIIKLNVIFHGGDLEPPVTLCNLISEQFNSIFFFFALQDLWVTAVTLKT